MMAKSQARLDINSVSFPFGLVAIKLACPKQKQRKTVITAKQPLIIMLSELLPFAEYMPHTRHGAKCPVWIIIAH